MGYPTNPKRTDVEAVKGLKTRRCEDLSEWDAFVRASPQGNIFCDSRLATAVDDKFEPWFLLRGDDVKAGIPLFRRPDGGATTMPFTYYQGLLLSPDVAQMKNQRYSNWLLQIVTRFLSDLTDCYSSLRLSLHPSLTDIRGFDWFNYGGPGRRCRILPRYTAIIDCDQVGDTQTLLKASRKDRRQDFRRAHDNRLKVVRDADVECLVSLYCDMFATQGIEVSGEHRSTLRRLSEAAISHDFGELLFVVDDKSKIQAAQLVLYDEHSGHAVAQASRETGRGNGASTLACVEFLEHVRKRGLRWADLNGANSPDRADFKHSLDAPPQLFFEIEWPCPVTMQ